MEPSFPQNSLEYLRQRYALYENDAANSKANLKITATIKSAPSPSLQSPNDDHQAYLVAPLTDRLDVSYRSQTPIHFVETSVNGVHSGRNSGQLSTRIFPSA